jgi:hypothetical protein
MPCIRQRHALCALVGAMVEECRSPHRERVDRVANHFTPRALEQVGQISDQSVRLGIDLDRGQPPVASGAARRFCASPPRLRSTPGARAGARPRSKRLALATGRLSRRRWTDLPPHTRGSNDSFGFDHGGKVSAEYLSPAAARGIIVEIARRTGW